MSEPTFEQKKGADLVISEIEKSKNSTVPHTLSVEFETIIALPDPEKERVRDSIKRKIVGMLVDTDIASARDTIGYLSGLSEPEKEEIARLSGMEKPSTEDLNDLKLLREKDVLRQKFSLNQEEINHILFDVMDDMRSSNELSKIENMIKDPVFVKIFDSFLEAYFKRTEEILKIAEKPQRILEGRRSYLSEILSALSKFEKGEKSGNATRMISVIDGEIRRMENLSTHLDANEIHE